MLVQSAKVHFCTGNHSALSASPHLLQMLWRHSSDIPNPYRLSYSFLLVWELPQKSNIRVVFERLNLMEFMADLTAPWWLSMFGRGPTTVANGTGFASAVFSTFVFIFHQQGFLSLCHSWKCCYAGLGKNWTGGWMWPVHGKDWIQLTGTVKTKLFHCTSTQTWGCHDTKISNFLAILGEVSKFHTIFDTQGASRRRVCHSATKAKPNITMFFKIKQLFNCQLSPESLSLRHQTAYSK